MKVYFSSKPKGVMVLLFCFICLTSAYGQFVRQHLFYPKLDSNLWISSEDIIPYLGEDSIYRFMLSATEENLHPNSTKIAFGALNSSSGEIRALKQPDRQPLETNRIRVPLKSGLHGDCIFYNEFQVSPFGEQSNWKTVLVHFHSTLSLWEHDLICRPLSNIFQSDDSSFIWLGSYGKAPFAVRADSLILLNLSSLKIDKIIPRSDYLTWAGLSNLNLYRLESLTALDSNEMVASLTLNDGSSSGHDFSDCVKAIVLSDLKLDQVKQISVYPHVDARTEFLPVYTAQKRALFAVKEDILPSANESLGTRKVFILDHHLDSLKTFEYSLNTYGLEREGLIYPEFNLSLMNGYFLVNQNHYASPNGAASRLHLFDAQSAQKLYSITTETNLRNKGILDTEIDRQGNVFFKGVHYPSQGFYWLGKISLRGQNPWFSRINDEGSSASSIRVYPNPSNGQLWLSLSEGSLALQRVLLYDTQGKVLQEFDLREGLDLQLQPNIANGLYYLLVLGEDGETRASQPFLLNR